MTYETDEDTGKSGVIEIRKQAFHMTKVDVILPNSVELVGKEAYMKYSGPAKTRNQTSNKLVFPTSLYDLSDNASSWEGFVENKMCIYVGDETNIPDMETQFKYIQDSVVNTTYTLNIYGVSGWQRNIIFGQNTSSDGLTITSMKNAIGNNGGRVIVFPKGKLTLNENSLNFDKNSGNYANYYLRVFQTESIDDLIVASNVMSSDFINGNSSAKFVYIFTGLNKSIESNSEWMTKLNYLKSTASVEVYYKDELTQENLTKIWNYVANKDNKTKLSSIIASPIKTWIDSLKVTSPSPLPKPPAPTTPTQTISSLLYIERKKLMIVSE